MPSFWASTVIGFIAFLGFIPTVLAANPAGRYLRRRIHVVGKKRRDKTVTWEARMALKRHWFYPAVRPFLGGLVGFAVAVVFFSTVAAHGSFLGSLVIVLGMCAGYGFAFAIAYPTFLRKRVERYCLLCAEEAARSLARLSEKGTAMPLLDAAAAESLPRLRMAAVAGYLEIGSPECLAKLEQLTHDQDTTVGIVAKFAHQELHKVIDSGLVLSVEPMEKLIERVQYCRRELDRRSTYVKRVDYDKKMEEAQKQIEQITRSQLHLRGAYPAIFCMNCLARAERLEGDEWEWVRCHRCKDAPALFYGVEEVVGQIGGVEDYRIEGGVLKVSLWNETKRQARPAEADRLEIVGGKGIQYDWAVSAVLEKMRNYNEGAAGQVPVVLVGKPTLSANSLALLQSYDPGFKGDGGEPEAKLR